MSASSGGEKRQTAVRKTSQSELQASTRGQAKGGRPEATLNAYLFRLDEDLQLVGRPQAEACFVDLEDARTAFLQQLQTRTTAQSHCGEPSDFTLATTKRKHRGLIASFQVL